jgi:hypothetical protein
LYKKTIPSLKRHKIIYIDQIVNKELKSIMEWPFIQLLTRCTKGRMPGWYKYIRSKTSTGTGLLQKQWANLQWMDQTQDFISQSQEQDGRKVNWYVLMEEKKPETLTWVRKKGGYKGPRYEFNQAPDPRYDKHYIAVQDYKTGHAILKECDRCKKEKRLSNERNEETEHISFMPESCNVISNGRAMSWTFDLVN